MATFKGILQDVTKTIEKLPDEQYKVIHAKFILKRKELGNHRSWYYSMEEVADIVGYHRYTGSRRKQSETYKEYWTAKR